jgi:hypothetical protein
MSRKAKNSGTPKKICFIACPIGESGSDIRVRSDQVLKRIIEPAISRLGYKPVRSDQIGKPGLITSQVIQHIMEDPLVIADLTDSNANVFYELAIRHAIRKPLIQLMDKSQKLPFDVYNTRTIFFDYRDLDSVEEARVEIAKQAKEVETNAKIETPISAAIDLQSLSASDGAQSRLLGDILAGLADLRSQVAALVKGTEVPYFFSNQTAPNFTDPQPRSFRAVEPGRGSYITTMGEATGATAKRRVTPQFPED